MFKISPSCTEGASSIPFGGTKILDAPWLKNKNISDIARNSLKDNLKIVHINKVLKKHFLYFLYFLMYYLREKYYKPVTVQHYIGDCVSCIPRLTSLNLQTNWT